VKTKIFFNFVILICNTFWSSQYENLTQLKMIAKVIFDDEFLMGKYNLD